MAPLPHSLIGLVMIVAVTVGLLAWSRRQASTSNRYPGARQVHLAHLRHLPIPPHLPHPPHRTTTIRLLRRPGYQLLFAVLFVTSAALINTISPKPLDASPQLPPPNVPLYAGGFHATPIDLSSQEKQYFTQYGGSAQRASYGPFGLLLVETASPLRHLHDPMVCLRGMGMQVELIGTDHATASTSYIASQPLTAGTDDTPNRYLVRVSYRSDHDQTATSIAEVVWLWLRNPNHRWTMIQRINPIDAEFEPTLRNLDRDAQSWETAIQRAFNLT